MYSLRSETGRPGDDSPRMRVVSRHGAAFLRSETCQVSVYCWGMPDARNYLPDPALAADLRAAMSSLADAAVKTAATSVQTAAQLAAATRDIAEAYAWTLAPDQPH